MLHLVGKGVYAIADRKSQQMAGFVLLFAQTIGDHLVPMLRTWFNLLGYRGECVAQISVVLLIRACMIRMSLYNQFATGINDVVASRILLG